MITIDNDFQNLIPPLTNEEFAQLESNILRDGIRDALITWHGILIDGHNRYRIAQKYGLTYRTVEKQFTDRNDAERWIILNQFGRRNLSAYDRSILALKLKPIIAEKAKEQQIRKPESVLQKVPASAARCHYRSRSRSHSLLFRTRQGTVRTLLQRNLLRRRFRYEYLSVW